MDEVRRSHFQVGGRVRVQRLDEDIPEAAGSVCDVQEDREAV